MATILTQASKTHAAPLAFGRPGATLLTMIAVARQRRMLLDADDDMLTDMGLTREMARTEAARPFWDLDGVPRYR